MAKYLLVSFKICPWVQRTAILLREKKVAFEFRYIEKSDNRPDWFVAISPHKKVPVLRIDDRISLFESSAISEYLDETIAPRLHPEDAAERAINRAWTDYLPTFARFATLTGYAESETEFTEALSKMAVPFARLEQALGRQGSGPFFNGERYSLVDAAYAPCLQRHFFLARVKKHGLIEEFPRLKAWGEALLARPSTHTFSPDEFDALYRANLLRRNVWLSQFVEPSQIAAQ